MAPYALAIQATGGGLVPGEKLIDLGRCPHCSIANPNMNKLWSDKWRNPEQRHWASFRCNSCSGVVTLEMRLDKAGRMDATAIFPDAKAAHEDLPASVRTFLQQAFETLHAPDAAAVMAGSAVDAMLKAHKLTDGSLYSRIDEALKQNLLTEGMAKWAHSVRLGSNRPRHADEKRPHVSPEEARQSVEFAEALGNFLFVLTAKIDRGIKAAEEAAPAEQ